MFFSKFRIFQIRIFILLNFDLIFTISIPVGSILLILQITFLLLLPTPSFWITSIWTCSEAGSKGLFLTNCDKISAPRWPTPWRESGNVCPPRNTKNSLRYDMLWFIIHTVYGDIFYIVNYSVSYITANIYCNSRNLPDTDLRHPVLNKMGHHFLDAQKLGTCIFNADFRDLLTEYPFLLLHLSLSARYTAFKRTYFFVEKIWPVQEVLT